MLLATWDTVTQPLAGAAWRGWRAAARPSSAAAVSGCAGRAARARPGRCTASPMLPPREAVGGVGTGGSWHALSVRSSLDLACCSCGACLLCGLEVRAEANSQLVTTYVCLLPVITWKVLCYRLVKK